MTVAGGQGVQGGSGNVQHNTFNVTRQAPAATPPDHVVAGNIPQEPPAFQPREDLMARLRAAGPGVSIVRSVTGMRGVGKTQLAAAYARECRQAGWRLVAWVNAESAATTFEGLALVAARLGIDGAGKTVETVGRDVRNWLEADGERCLVVFDNVTDPDVIEPYVPSVGAPQVLITSTESSVTALGRPLGVAVFTEEQSLAFLAERAGRPGEEGARALARELGCLPLALSQAAAVIAAQHLTYEVYLSRLRSYPAERYLPKAKAQPYPRAVAEAILLSIDAVTAADPAGLCGDLLDLVAVLSTAGVSRDLLYLALPELATDIVDEALGRLAAASLLAFGADDSTVTAHRLVMRVARERRARAGTLPALGVAACAALESSWLSLGEPWRNRMAARDFVQQVTALHGHLSPDLPPGDPLVEGLLSLRMWALWALNELADSAVQAVGLGEPLAADSAHVWGETHPDTLHARINLATAYTVAGRAADAVPLLERALADQVRVLGEEHPNTLIARDRLGRAYAAVGRSDDPERQGDPAVGQDGTSA